MTTPDNSRPAAITFGDLTRLDAIERDIWVSLQRSVTDRNSGWRLPVLATRCGDDVRQRTVVLRRVDQASGRLLAHTDRRSPKVAQLTTHPTASWLFYDHPSATQLVITGRVSLHTDDTLADELWTSEPDSSLRGYLGPHPPGASSVAPSHNLPPQWLGRVPSRDDLAAAREQFAVICCQVDCVEWLHLQRDGNLRARFPHDSSTDAQWLHP